MNLCINFAHAETLNKIHHEVNELASRSQYIASMNKGKILGGPESETSERQKNEQVS